MSKNEAFATAAIHDGIVYYYGRDEDELDRSLLRNARDEGIHPSKLRCDTTIGISREAWDHLEGGGSLAIGVNGVVIDGVLCIPDDSQGHVIVGGEVYYLATSRVEALAALDRRFEASAKILKGSIAEEVDTGDVLWAPSTEG